MILQTAENTKNIVYATREPPKMVRFDWFAISGYWVISHD